MDNDPTLAQRIDARLSALGVTAAGQPRHPLSSVTTTSSGSPDRRQRRQRVPVELRRLRARVRNAAMFEAVA